VNYLGRRSNSERIFEMIYYHYWWNPNSWVYTKKKRTFKTNLASFEKEKEFYSPEWSRSQTLEIPNGSKEITSTPQGTDEPFGSTWPRNWDKETGNGEEGLHHDHPPIHLLTVALGKLHQLYYEVLPHALCLFLKLKKKSQLQRNFQQMRNAFVVTEETSFKEEIM
jgi:hypothetical protein